MLKKDICQKCINERRKLPNVQKRTIEDMPWEAKDDETWEEGYVFCPHAFGEKIDLYEVSEAPPENCPFTDDHIAGVEIKVAQKKPPAHKKDELEALWDKEEAIDNGMPEEDDAQ